MRYTCTAADIDGQRQLVIVREPWWTAAVLTLADAVCAATRHRLCMTLVLRAFHLSERHAERLVLDCSPQRVAEYSRWRGWTDDEA